MKFVESKSIWTLKRSPQKIVQNFDHENWLRRISLILYCGPQLAAINCFSLSKSGKYPEKIRKVRSSFSWNHSSDRNSEWSQQHVAFFKRDNSIFRSYFSTRTVCGMAIDSSEFFRPKRSTIHPPATVPTSPPIPIILAIHPISSWVTTPDGNGHASLLYNVNWAAIHPTNMA